MQIRRVLALGIMLMLATSGSPALAQKNDGKPQQTKRSKAEQADVDALLTLVDGVSAGKAQAPADVPLAWESNHFVKGQMGATYVPFTVTIDRSKLANPNSAAVYIRFVDKNATPPEPPAAPTDKDKDKPAATAPTPVYPWSTIHWLKIPDDNKISRAVALPPGDYEAFIAIRDKAPEKEQKNAPALKTGLLRHEIKVPDFNNGLVTSSVILAKAVEPVTTPLNQAQQEENPYVFGPMRITPSVDGKFAKAAELQVVFWIYGATEATGGKPDVQVEFAFHQRLAEGEKYFNKTAPQQLNGQTLPPEFSVAAGHQLPGSLVVPLASFPEGNYRLEIKVTDKPSGKTVTQNVNFTVSPS